MPIPTVQPDPTHDALLQGQPKPTGEQLDWVFSHLADLCQSDGQSFGFLIQRMYGFPSQEKHVCMGAGQFVTNFINEAIEPSKPKPATQPVPPTCITCKWWQDENDDDRYNSVINPYDPVTYEQLDTEEEIRAKWGHTVRKCRSPKVLFYQRPEIGEAAIMDGSQYCASLLTGEQFGCVLHEPVEQK